MIRSTTGDFSLAPLSPPPLEAPRGTGFRDLLPAWHRLRDLAW